MPFCRNCGNEINDADRFCLKCGSPIVEAADIGPEITRATTMPSPEPHEKKNKGLIIAVICLGIAVVAVLAFLATWFFIKPRRDVVKAADTFAQALVKQDAGKIIKLTDEKKDSEASQYLVNLLDTTKYSDDKNAFIKAVSETMTFEIDESTLTVDKDKAFVKVVFTMVDYEKVLKNKEYYDVDELTADLAECDDTMEFKVTFEFEKIGDIWSISNLKDKDYCELYNYYSYEPVIYYDNAPIIEAASMFATAIIEHDCDMISALTSENNTDISSEFELLFDESQYSDVQNEFIKTVSDTITYQIDVYYDVEVNKDEASVDVVFSMVDYEEALKDDYSDIDEAKMLLNNCEDTKDISITFEFEKIDGSWFLSNMNDEVFDKLLDFYSYELEFVYYDNLIKVGIINNDPNESGYRTANDNDMKATFTAENGYDASFFYSLKNDEQIAAAYQFIQDDVDYLIISAAGTSGWDSVLTDAQAAGIEVILFDRAIDADDSLYVAFIVSDMYQEGLNSVAWLEAQGLDEYKIIHIQGVMGSAAQIGRSQALEEMVEANDNWTLVTQQTAEWNAETAEQIVQAVIDSGEDFNVIYAENDDMAKGAVAALDNAGITHGIGGDVIIMGYDCNQWALEEVLAGNWNFDQQCNPFQAAYIDEVIQNLEQGIEPEQKIIVMEEAGFDAATITQDDVDTYGI